MGTAAFVTDSSNNEYDEVPYESYPYSYTHPDKLATIARLFGLKPAPVTKCRVLELGCASGGNLIPMAIQFPESEFIGIDLSVKQIEDGKEMIAAFGLKNITLKHMDIKNVINEEPGRFDYIISHGIYSWVPDHVKDAMFEICKQKLTQEGVAYISYNVLPGWHIRGMVREMMLYHAGQLSDPNKRAEQSRALMEFINSSVQYTNVYASILKHELDFIRVQKDSYLLHDYLEEINTPVYFYQFVQRASNHGLQFLGEADFAVMLASNFGPGISETLNRLSNDVIKTEQYMDFLRNRAFRMTLLCRSNIQLNRNVQSHLVRQFRVSGLVKPVNEKMNFQSPQNESFALPNGLFINTADPRAKATLQCIYEAWPQSLSFEELYAAAAARVSSVSVKSPSAVEQEKESLSADILNIYSMGHFKLSTFKADFVTTVSDFPKVSKLALYQANKGIPVTNQLHEMLTPDVTGNALIKLCDGSNSRSQILEKFIQIVKSGELKLERQIPPEATDEQLHNELQPYVENVLQTLGKYALLVE